MAGRQAQMAGADIHWRFGLYLRLSKEDVKQQEKAGEIQASKSIQNQERYLRDWLSANIREPYEIIRSFVDDGRSGALDTRGEYQDMRAAVERGEINGIVTKDLSRAFRNLAHQDEFLEEFCPRHRLRFIATYNPYIDSYLYPESASSFAVQVHGLMNENTCREASAKVRAIFNSKRSRGEFLSGHPPYGYKRDPENKYRFVVDEEAAAVVGDIFRWYVQQGYSKSGIARRLNGLGVPNPSLYKRQRGMGGGRYGSGTSGLWSAGAVADILRREAYIGRMVLGKERTVSYKNKARVAVPQSGWFVTEGTHQAIVSEELFQQAQQVDGRYVRAPAKNAQHHLFSGFLRCDGCGRAMHRKTSKGYAYYSCRTHRECPGTACFPRSIREDQLEEVVLAAVQLQLALVEDWEGIVQQVQKRRGTGGRMLSGHLAEKERQLQQLEAVQDELYLDWKAGIITNERYERLLVVQQEKAAETARQLAQTKKEMEENEGEDAGESCAREIVESGNITRLERGILHALVQDIYILKDGQVSIVFRFADEWRRTAVEGGEERLGLQ